MNHPVEAPEDLSEEFRLYLEDLPYQPDPKATYYRAFAPLAKELRQKKKDPLALLEDVANLALQATEYGSYVTISETGEIELLPKISALRLLPTLCGSIKNWEEISRTIYDLKPPVINNRQEFEETSDRLRRISRIFHQAADINPYRLLSVLDNLNLLHTLPAFFTRDTLDLTFTYKVLSLQDNVDAEIAQLLGFTAPNNLSHLVHNEILFDFIHQVMMNPNRFAGRLSAEDFSLLTSLLSQVKPGTRRLKEAIEGKGVILEEQEEEKELLFRLYPDTRNLADILEEYDITQRHDEEMIGRCLELAEDARVQGEAEPIACVLVNTATGERIEKSHNVKSGRVYEHAEKLALLEAETLWGIQDIENWELYLSIQPCPGCMELILQCFPHIKSIVFSAYSSQGQYSQQMADDNIIRASAKQDDTPSGFFETRDGVRTGEGTSFYRDRLGWTQMIKPFDPKRQTYWQRKFTALLFRGE